MIISYYFSFFWLSKNQFRNSYKTSYHCNTWRNINGLSWIHSYRLSSVTVKHGLDCRVVEGCWLRIMFSLSFSLCYMSLFSSISEALIMLKEKGQPGALNAPSMCREALYYVRVGKNFFFFFALCRWCRSIRNTLPWLMRMGYCCHTLSQWDPYYVVSVANCYLLSLKWDVSL